MKTYPCAKINLGLYVTERRPDGYHNLQTVFYPVPLCDELEIEVSDADGIEVLGMEVAGDANDNLVMRVVRQLRSDGFDVPPLKITLTKNIPTGAGLGGGSSDAAFAMKMINQMFGLGLGNEEMERRVARLGADCAFFIRCKPVYATGIGDVFSRIDVDLNGLWIVIVKPDDFISTREAYQGVSPRMPETDLMVLLHQPISTWPAFVGNDFELSILLSHKRIGDIKNRLYDNGALYASMSGSGSAVFGIFSEQPLPEVVRSFQPDFTFVAQLGKY